MPVALCINSHGPYREAKLSELARPTVTSDQVLVEVAAAGVNPSDLGSIAGAFAGAPLPRIVGRDFSGRVVEGAPDLVGRDVYGSGGDLGITRDGTFAEYLVLRRDEVALRPAALDAEHAAAVGVPFVTAALALTTLRSGQWVAIAGANGSVGRAATQLARARGAHVIAVVRDATKKLDEDGEVTDAAHLLEVAARVTNGRGCNLALNGVGASLFAPLMAVLAERGSQVIYAAATGREAQLDLFDLYRGGRSVRGITTAHYGATACARLLDQLAPLFESGALRPTIAARFPFADAIAAFDHTARNRGKAVLVMR